MNFPRKLSKVNHLEPVVTVVTVVMEVIMVTELDINNTTQFTGVRYACIVDSTN